jgi:hypothetical protein
MIHPQPQTFELGFEILSIQLSKGLGVLWSIPSFRSLNWASGNIPDSGLRPRSVVSHPQPWTSDSGFGMFSRPCSDARDLWQYSQVLETILSFKVLIHTSEHFFLTMF